MERVMDQKIMILSLDKKYLLTEYFELGKYAQLSLVLKHTGFEPNIESAETLNLSYFVFIALKNLAKIWFFAKKK